MTLFTLLFLIIFMIGIYFYIKQTNPNSLKGIEGFINNQPRCPNMLIQKGSKYYLYNSKLAKVPGVNPIEFNNLEEYVEFLDWQRSQGIRCPVLYLQQTYDAQGNNVYKVRPSVTEPQGGLPPSIASSKGNTIYEEPGIIDKPLPPNPTLLVDATRNDPPYNKNSYPAYDQTSYYVGTTTPLDAMNTKEENMLYSPNPMDPNWGGNEYTQSLVDKGYYKDDNVSIYVP
jgi:hypothetical protein